MSKANNVAESLLKYETPILVSSSFKSQHHAASPAKTLAPVQTSHATSTEDYLNKILPP